MHPRPLALTSQQLSIVREHAKLIPAVLRDKYLMAIADGLTAIDTVTDEAVAYAVHEALGQMLGGPPRRCCNGE